jgi:hypothetical protein
MKTKLSLSMLPQPDDTTCGPTCLHSVYSFYGDDIGLDRVIKEVRKLDSGGTLAVFLGCHALKRGYRARIFTYNLQIFDPTWFNGATDIADKLMTQAEHKKKKTKLVEATQGYLEFLSLGGQIAFNDLTGARLRRHLYAGIPILTGLSSTFLYRSAREFGPDGLDDDVRGEPSGHFVVLCGYNRQRRTVQIADPYRTNPYSSGGYYMVGLARLVNAILLGILTYDANILIIEPGQ